MRIQKKIAEKPLDAETLNTLFATMSTHFGKRFVDMWNWVDVMAVRADWANALGDMDDEQLQRGFNAMQKLEWPPSLPEFMSLCGPKRHAPSAQMPDRVKPNPEIAKKLDEAINGSIKKSDDVKVDHKAWARKILANPSAYSAYSIKCARQALCNAEAA